MGVAVIAHYVGIFPTLYSKHPKVMTKTKLINSLLNQKEGSYEFYEFQLDI